jgi:hypothetical protein
VSDGRPYRLALPVRQLFSTLTLLHGYTVYYYPDNAHLLATPAEDHTPYSETGWPIVAEYGVGWAIDIMPHNDPAMPTPGQIGAKMVSDRQAGRPETAPIKYINWTDPSDNCWHDSWQPDHAQRSSTDRGHTHLSQRSDMIGSAAMEHYDPVAELLFNPGGDMPVFVHCAENGGFYAYGLGEPKWYTSVAEFGAARSVWGAPQTEVALLNQVRGRFGYVPGSQEAIDAGQADVLADAHGNVLPPVCSDGSSGNGNFTISFTGTGAAEPA